MRMISEKCERVPLLVSGAMHCSSQVPSTLQRSRAASNILEYGQYKIVYKQYAGLFFSCCIDLSDNELVVLESMHLFVELLDHYFEQVCELDLIFNFHKVYLILDQFILAGEVQETSKASHEHPLLTAPSAGLTRALVASHPFERALTAPRPRAQKTILERLSEIERTE